MIYQNQLEDNAEFLMRLRGATRLALLARVVLDGLLGFVVDFEVSIFSQSRGIERTKTTDQTLLPAMDKLRASSKRHQAGTAHSTRTGIRTSKEPIVNQGLGDQQRAE